MAKAAVLTEALPYMQDFRGSVVLVKLGGSVNKLTSLSVGGPRDISENGGIMYAYHPLLDGNTGAYFNTLIDIQKM